MYNINYVKKVKLIVSQSCLTLCDPMDCSLPGSSVLGISQVWILEQASTSFSRDSLNPGIELGFSTLQTNSLPSEPSGKPNYVLSAIVNMLHSLSHLTLQQGFPRSSVGKESACHRGDLSLIPGLERLPGEENGNSLQYSCLGNPTDRGDCPWGRRSWTRLSN